MKKRLLLTMAVLFMGLQALMAQSGSIRGKILDDKGDPVPGATIRIKGTNKGTVTDANGNFKLNAEEGSTLSISAIGLKATEKSAQDGMSVKMAADQQSLRETVVTAQAVKREKASLGYATTTLNNNDLNAGNNVSALGALQGKVSGVNITSTTGGPGGSTRVVIRGEKSIGGNNNALIVIDGIPVNNGNRLRSNSLKQVDFGNRGNDVNPDDIESISVLKGAAATALYGSEGANGAIMITTKSGKAKSKTGKTEVGFSTGYTWSNILKFPTFQNQFGEGDLNGIPDDRRENFSWGLPFDGQIRPWGQIIDGKQQVKRYEAQENNVRDFFNRGKAWENNLTLSGGTERSNYFIGFNSLNSKGVIPNTYNDKYSFRVNANHEFANDFFSSVNVNYINGASRVDQGGQGEGSVWNNVCQQPRDIPIPDLADLGNVFNSMDYIDTNGVHRYGYYGAYTENPYWVAQYFDNRNKYDRILGQATVGHRFNQHLTLSNRFGGEVLSDRTYLKSPKLNSVAFEELWSGSPKSFNGGYYESTDNFSSYFNDLMLNANFQIDKLGITALVGHSVSSRADYFLSSSIDPVTNGLVIEGFYNFSNAQSKIASENIITRNRKVGVYGTVNFDFNKFFFLELTGRNDWSSTLAANNRSYFYPSVSASWLFSQHLPDAAKKVLNYGKLRGNISSVGNDATAYQNNDPGFTSTNITSGFGSNIFPFNDVPGFSLQNRMGNPALKPERQVGKEIGIDLSLFEDRLSWDFTVYSNKTKDQILAVPTPSSSGYTSRIINAGTIKNTGFETGLRITPVKMKGIRWDLYGTYTRNKNEVLDLPNGVDQLVIGGYSGMSIVAAVGKPFGTFYAVDLLKDANGNQVIDSATGAPRSTSAPVYLGSFQPKFIASWGTSFSAKGFNLNVLFDTKQGGYIYSRTKDILEFVGVTPSSTLNNREPFLWNNSVYENSEGDYVKNTSILTDVYNYYTAANVKPAGQDLVKAGYVKLREVSVGYKLPQKWFNNTFIGSGTVSVFGNNLVLWTNKGNDYIDPEVNSGGATNEQGFDFSARPSIRNYGFRVGLTF
ncbi:MAG TPA: SusC/RagA family TonB-linked outer membrane protein [Chitinophagaceae bacterium]|nr:SusC/RagA family TonB-linked outer membrane protein [Chitinophagaceae bacterium]HNF70967.1 SusC/RagA family TonB-linked outer membrane protein [Chitinophagaceae bacterium]